MTAVEGEVVGGLRTAPARARMSVVIPAHNEARVIARTLDTLLRGAEPGELEVVVACNGCHDATADIVRSYAPRVRLLELAERSKAAALNAGDVAVTVFPRVFLDADVEVGIDALRALGTTLSAGSSAVAGPLAAAPRLEVATQGCSRAVTAYYAVWQRLPYVANGVLGSGLYAVSEQGRARFAEFPALVADDLFVQRLFGPGERVTSGGTYRIHPPRNVTSLLRSKARVYAGNRQYAGAVAGHEVPVVAASTPHDGGTPGTRSALLGLLREPRWWGRLAVYAAIVVVSKVRAETRVRRGRTTRWDQDQSGRAGDLG